MNTIFDKHGHAYTVLIIETGIGQNFELWCQDASKRGARIGYANTHGKFEAAFLDDIHIHDDAWVFQPPTGPFRWFKRRKGGHRNFQRLGLGTRLLGFVLETLKARGVKRISGRLKAHDFLVNPNLPKWYSALGFEVADGKISKEL